jgi:hypothetical protein
MKTLLVLAVFSMSLVAFGKVNVHPTNSTIPVLTNTVETPLNLGPTLPPSPWDDCGYGPGCITFNVVRTKVVKPLQLGPTLPPDPFGPQPEDPPAPPTPDPAGCKQNACPTGPNQ